MNSDDELYRDWLALRRAERPGPELTDRVMESVASADIHESVSRRMHLLTWIDRSRARRRAACFGALAVGSVPFIYFAYVSQLFAF